MNIKKVLLSCLTAGMLMSACVVSVWAEETDEMIIEEIVIDESEDVSAEVPEEEAEVAEVVEDAVPEEVEDEAGDQQAEATYTGWRQANGNYYYIYQNKIAIGWRKIDGKEYYFKKTGTSVTKGKMLTGWQNIGTRTFYFKKTGAPGTRGQLLTGWRTIGNNKFYFKKSGDLGKKGMLLTGWQNIGGETFYFKKSGALGTKGKVLVGWQTIGNKKFYFENTGVTGTHGQMLTGWAESTTSSNEYFFKRTGDKGVKGAMLTGWQRIDGDTYYFKSTGVKSKTVEADYYIHEKPSVLASNLSNMKSESVSGYKNVYTDSKERIVFGTQSGYEDRITILVNVNHKYVTLGGVYLGATEARMDSIMTAEGWTYHSSDLSDDGTCWHEFYIKGNDFVFFDVSIKTGKVVKMTYTYIPALPTAASVDDASESASALLGNIQ